MSSTILSLDFWSCWSCWKISSRAVCNLLVAACHWSTALRSKGLNSTMSSQSSSALSPAPSTATVVLTVTSWSVFLTRAINWAIMRSKDERAGRNGFACAFHHSCICGLDRRFGGWFECAAGLRARPNQANETLARPVIINGGSSFL